MANATLTAANSVITLSITGLFPVPQTLQAYAADDVLTTEQIAPIEIVMGVDGRLAGGYTPVPRRQTFVLQGDSPSNLMFESWQVQQDTALDAFIANGFIVLPALNRAWAMTKGFLTGYSPMPDVRRIIQPRRYVITWQSIIPAPI